MNPLDDLTKAKTEQLIIQLLDTLIATILWIENFSIKTGVNIPNKQALIFLLTDAQKLILQITCDDKLTEQVAGPSKKLEPPHSSTVCVQVSVKSTRPSLFIRPLRILVVDIGRES